MSVNNSSVNGTFEAGNTIRVTRVGKILRRTKADELPQLINVLKGEMSFVGPRPEVEKWVSVYPDRWAYVHQVKPGITDYASIEFRNEEEILAKSTNPEKTYQDEILPRKLELNEQYVREQSFFKDINIIFRTICIVLIK
jgi:lipopolysaccharide/colanic/teichoic acid biosynthesis glycosyltransferase